MKLNEKGLNVFSLSFFFSQTHTSILSQLRGVAITVNNLLLTYSAQISM